MKFLAWWLCVFWTNVRPTDWQENIVQAMHFGVTLMRGSKIMTGIQRISIAFVNVNENIYASVAAADSGLGQFRKLCKYKWISF